MPVSKVRKKKQSNHSGAAAADQHAPVHIGPKPWVAPLMVASLVFGLLWIVVFYLAGDRIGFMQTIGNLGNVLIGFGFIGVGFALSTKWR